MLYKKSSFPFKSSKDSLISAMQIGAKLKDKYKRGSEGDRSTRNERCGHMLLVIVKTYPVPSGHLRDARKGWRSGVGGLSVTQPEVEGGEGPEKGAFFFRVAFATFVRSYEGGLIRAFVDRAPQHETIVAQVWRLVVGGGCRVYFAPVQGEAKAKTTTTTTPQVRKYTIIGDHAHREIRIQYIYIYKSIHMNNERMNNTGACTYR